MLVRPVAGLGRRAPQPPLGGSSTAESLDPSSISGGFIDPSHSGAVVTPAFTPTVTSSTDTQTQTLSSSTSAPASSQDSGQTSSADHQATIIIVVGSVVGTFVVALVVFLIWRSSRNNDRRRSRSGRRKEWKELEGDGTQVSPPKTESYAPSHEWEHKRSLSSGAPPTLPPIQQEVGEHSFLTMQSSQSVPRIREPPVLTRKQSGEYSATYLRSIYSAYDTQSIASNATSSRRSLSKSKNNRELIAMEKLIAALDLSADEARARQRMADGHGPESSNGQAAHAQTTDFPLPPPAVFRAALGGSDWDYS